MCFLKEKTYNRFVMIDILLKMTSHLYFPRMYSYVIRMSLICTRMSSECGFTVSNVTQTSDIQMPYENIRVTYRWHMGDIWVTFHFDKSVKNVKNRECKNRKNLFSFLNLSQKYGEMFEIPNSIWIRISKNSITYVTVTFVTFHF